MTSTPSDERARRRACEVLSAQSTEHTMQAVLIPILILFATPKADAQCPNAPQDPAEPPAEPPGQAPVPVCSLILQPGLRLRSALAPRQALDCRWLGAAAWEGRGGGQLRRQPLAARSKTIWQSRGWDGGELASAASS